MLRHSAHLAVLFLLPVAAFAQEEQGNVDWTFKNKKLRDQIAAYEKAVKKLDGSFQERQSSLKEAYDEKRKQYRLELIVQFEEALQEASKAVDLKQANKIDAAIKALHGGAEPAGVAGGPVTGKVRIPKDAVEWNGHHYKVFDTPMTWHVAQRNCELAGGHLVQIESQEEHTFILKLVKRSRLVSQWVWIDGSDAVTEGQWILSNGKTMTYSSWVEGEPNNGKDLEHSAQIFSVNGLWYDGKGTARHPFICEWDQ